jgi:hypothetical protein
MLIDHPIVFIEKLLKLGLGDKGRLLYLRNYLKSGKILYDSDKKFLNTLRIKLDDLESGTREKFTDNCNSKNKPDNTDIFFGNENNFVKHGGNNPIDKNTPSTFDSDILKIQNSISELQKRNSKLKDNLELILISRENRSQTTIEKLTPLVSSSSIRNNPHDSFSSFKNNPNSTNLKIFGMKKHDMMVYVSAGLFTLWYAGFQNIIDLGPFQSISLGLSAASAVSAGIFYKKQKISK